MDFTGRPENLSFILKNGKLLVGWGDQSTPVASASPADDAAIAAGAKLFAHMVYASNVSYVTHLIGGSGADLFDVYRTSTAQMTLDGGKGNDTFVFHSGSDTINALVESFCDSFETAIFFNLHLAAACRGRALLETPED